MSDLALILAGGQGSRLSILSSKRAKPAVAFAGKYRIIDFALSNVVNSEIYRVAVLTQYRPHSLMQHIGIGTPWDLNRTPPRGVQIWQPYQDQSGEAWYRGTADALYQNRNFIAEAGCDRALVLSGDHIYKQDYRELLAFHDAKGADLTVAVMHVPLEETFRFGIMDVDSDDRIVKFTEKPKQATSTLASMGIYVFNTDFLLAHLEEDGRDPTSNHDFGRNLIPKMVANDKVYAYPYSGYWVDVGTLESYWETNLALLVDPPPLDLSDPTWVIHTRSKERPPVWIGGGGKVHDAMLSNGCKIDGTVLHSVLSPGVIVEAGAIVRDSVILNDTVVGAGVVVDRCVIDKEIQIGSGAKVGVGDDNTPNRLEPDKLNTGITLAGKRAHIPAGVVIGRNCRIDPNTTAEDYDQLEVPSGGTILRRR
jgi:glucose-1-phosphate adenylyltransferase